MNLYLFRPVDISRKSLPFRAQSNSLWITLLLAVMVLFSGTRLTAQDTTATILGSVSDPSGAAVGNADVTVTNTQTNIAVDTKTTESGAYTVPNLIPGTYSISIKVQGFQTISIPNVIVAAGDRRRADAALVVGAVSETVEISTAPPILQTDASSVGGNVTERAVQDLPLNGRNFINLVQVMPGATEGAPNSINSGNRPDDRRPSSSISINGQSEVLNDQLVDGLDNNERVIGTIGVRPSIDSIQEVRILTNSFSSDGGRAGGGLINVITKSGTNNFHGSLYEFFRNDKLNAYAYQFGAQAAKPRLRQNQFGGSLGGPIFKDKAFFHGDAEFFRLIKGGLPSNLTVPSAYELAHPGDFSDAIPSSGCATIAATVVDPTQSHTTGCVYDPNPASPGYLRNPIAGNVVPGSYIDPVGLAYFKLYPAPNTGKNGYVGTRNQQQYSTVYDVRVDYHFNTNNQIFAKYIVNDIFTFSPGALPISSVNGFAIDPQTGNGFGSAPQIARNTAVIYTHTFTSNMLMNVGAAWTHINNASYPLNYGVNPNTKLGQPNVNISQLTSGLAVALPTGLTGLGGGSNFVPLQNKDNSYQLNGNIFYNRGNHSFRFGAAGIRRIALNLQDNQGEGSWTFRMGAPGLLMGIFSAATRNNNLYPPTYLTWEPSVYVQDDWHVRQNLTLNLGVRYDIYTPFTEKKNHISNFDEATATIVQAGVNGVSNTANVKTDYSNFAPRVGFALTATPSLVIRGGFGLAFFPSNYMSPVNLKNPPNIAIYGNCSSVQAANGTSGCNTGFTRFNQGMPSPNQNPSTAQSALVGSIPATVDYNFRSGYLEQFNLTAQKDFKGNTLTVSYVGQLGRHLSTGFDINRAPLGNKTGSQTLRRYYSVLPGVTTITRSYATGASSYHSLQAVFERRFHNGLGFNVNTTWAHLLDNAPNINGQSGNGVGQVLATQKFDDYGNGDLDVRNRIVVTGNYALPFGKGVHGLRGALLGGWRTNVLYLWSTGQTFTVLNSTNVSGTSPGGSADRPNVSGDPFQNITPVFSGAMQFFRASAFVAQSAGDVGNERRNPYHGPHFRHWDMSLFKEFAVYRETHLQFRAEAFNIANQANFSNPVSGLGSTTTLGALTSTLPSYQPRLVQFAVKYEF